MRNLTDQLANYAAYHRDRRNIATHFIGIPMIVFAVTVLLSRPAFEVAGVSLNPAWLVVAAGGVFYLMLSRGYGLVMIALLVLSAWASGIIAAQSTATWLAAGIGFFVVGWVLQFIGHYYEGRKPAFVDDLVGLLIGPLFVVAEVAFALGLSARLKAEIQKRVGPTHGAMSRAQAT